MLIILGDIGLNFESTKENQAFDKFFLSANKNIAFIEGNHENFDYLNSFPEEEWNGGTVNRLTPYIVHLKRGNIYTINGQTFFTFGGCKSSPKWKEMGLWHYGEEPEDHELKLAYSNLEKAGHKVDYVLTHKYEQTPPRGTVSEKLLELTNYIDENVDFKKWYFGHWHYEGEFDKKHIFLYDILTPLD